MSSKSTSYCVVFLLAGFIVSSACSSSSNPAGPFGQRHNHAAELVDGQDRDASP